MSRALQFQSPTAWIGVVNGSPCLLFIVLLIRRQAMEEWRRAQHQQHRFSTGGAQCTYEDDRAPVMANIVASFRMDPLSQ